MNTLKSAVQAIGPQKTAAQIVTELGELDVKSTDSTPYTWSGVSDKLIRAGIPVSAIDTLIASLPQVEGGVTLNASLTSGGADFSLPSIQAGLDAVGVSFGPDSAPLIAALKAIGVTYDSRWKILDLGELPTVEQVQTVLDQLEVESWAATVINNIIQPMIDAGNTKAEIITAVQNS